MRKSYGEMTGKFSIGDAVKPVNHDDLVGVVSAHDHARGLIRVRWETRVEEWMPPEELRLLKASEN